MPARDGGADDTIAYLGSGGGRELCVREVISREASAAMRTGFHVYINDGPSAPHLMRGEPFIVEEPSMRILEEPSTFLRRHYVESGKRKSIETWRAAAYQLKGWLEFLEAQGLDWRIASIDDLKNYRDALRVAVSPHSHEHYADATIRNYMLTVIAFYEFATQRAYDWYEGSLGATKEVKRRLVAMDKDALAHTRKGDPSFKQAAAKELLPKRGRKHAGIRPFTVLEWRTFTSLIGPMPTEQAINDPRLSRDRLLCELSFYTGLRLQELLGLRTYQFRMIVFDKSAAAAYSGITLRKETTKGHVERTIRIPNWLVEEVNTYIEGERARALKQRADASNVSNRKTPGDPVALFLAEPGSGRVGTPIGKRRCQQIVKENCFKAKLVAIEQRYDPDTGESREVKVAKHCFHDLRHSYAVWTYWAEKQLGNSEPWKLIQAQLGHEQLQTTIDTYLNYVEIFDGLAVPIDVRQLLGLC